jgi:hypothetical protein
MLINLRLTSGIRLILCRMRAGFRRARPIIRRYRRRTQIPGDGLTDWE